MKTKPYIRTLLGGVVVGATVAGCGTTTATDKPAPRTPSSATSTAVNPEAGGSRPFFVASLEELSARSDVVVRGRLSGSETQEPADEKGESGLTLVTTPFAVSSWMKGSGPESISLGQLPLGAMEEKVAEITKGNEYVLFLEKISLRGEARYILVGGVGAYRVNGDGSLSRTEQSEDRFPQHLPGVDSLERAVHAAPTSWTKTP